MNSFLDLHFFNLPIQVFETLSSTNDYMKEIVSKGKVKEGQTILTEFQTHGKGQQLNKWYSSTQSNLLFSIFLKPNITDLDFIFIFNFNKLISISIVTVLNKLILSAGFKDKCSIKWPNDIILKDKKIGGILIENSLRGQNIEYSIVGIGLNINETDFPPELFQASSLKLLFDFKWDRKIILEELLKNLEDYYEKFNSNFELFSTLDYETLLYRREIESQFKVKNELLTGKIKGINSRGLLKVELNNELHLFQFKEIELIY